MIENDALRRERRIAISRRQLLCDCGGGLGALALTALLQNGDIFAAEAPKNLSALNPLAPKPPMFTARAKRVIFLFMAGSPSQLDLFDYKPKLKEMTGQPIPASVVGDQRFAFIQPNAKLLGTPRTFARYGKCGSEISDALPHLSKIVDDITIVKSATTDAFNHAPAEILLNTGSQQLGRPSMGSWLTYGLGSEASDLPGYVVLGSGGTSGGASSYGSGFLPTVHQGVLFRPTGEPILFLSNPHGVDAKMQRDSLDAIRDLNNHRLGAIGDPEIATRIAAYETAFRMQTSAPELMDFSKETKETLDMYGVTPGPNAFANNCLLARRMAERGMRFISIFQQGWDHHGGKGGGIIDGLNAMCSWTDQASAALITDLKQRGMLNDTLVIWSGEFGRTPMIEDRDPKYPGRDHHPAAFTLWMAGGGVKRGFALGRTDELGYHVVEDRVHVHDLHATILHLMGIDHTKLTYRFQGRNFRLTDVSGEVVHKLIA